MILGKCITYVQFVVGDLVLKMVNQLDENAFCTITKLVISNFKSIGNKVEINLSDKSNNLVGLNQKSEYISIENDNEYYTCTRFYHIK